MLFKLGRMAVFLMAINSLPMAAQNSDAEKQRAEYEKKAWEELDSRTQEFVGQLQIDDFQKEIVKQKIISYFQKKVHIHSDVELKYFERDEKLSRLTESHFSDIKELISDETMAKIKSFVKDGGAEMKKNKKKHKRKNKKD